VETKTHAAGCLVLENSCTENYIHPSQLASSFTLPTTAHKFIIGYTYLEGRNKTNRRTEKLSTTFDYPNTAN
jgi:hypothetical protein